MIDIGNFTVIESETTPPVLCFIRFRGIIRGVGIIEMNPGENSLLRLVLQPFIDFCQHFVSPSLDRVKAYCFVLCQVKIIIVVVKTLIQPPARIENKGTHEGSGCIAFVFHGFSQSKMALIEVKSPVIADAMKERIGPRQDRSMGRKS